MLTGVWITTGGTMYNDVARYIGEARHTCIQQSGNNTCMQQSGNNTCIQQSGTNTCIEQSGNTCQKPILLGFANLKDVKNYQDIRQQSRSWSAPTPNIDTTDKPVRAV